MIKEKMMFSNTAKIGLIAGLITVSMCMIGIIESFSERDIVFELATIGNVQLLSLAQIMYFIVALTAGYLAVRKAALSPMMLIHGAVAGLLTAVPVFLLVMLTQVWESIRDSFINVSPDLITVMTLGHENVVTGATMLFPIFTVLGIIGALLVLLPGRVRGALLSGFLWAMGFGLMSEILVTILRPRLERETMDIIFGKSGLMPATFFGIFGVITLLSLIWRSGAKTQYDKINAGMSKGTRSIRNAVALLFVTLFVLILPSLLGVYLTEIVNNVGLYILMGLGLNIAVGMAGLLDLGYVTNFAVGAYLMALLTSTSEYGLANPISFWIALPICVLAAMLTGFLFALPVLRMRGDYLAIATLGFGEIIRVLAKSDALKEFIGGAQGILKVPKAAIGGVAATFADTILQPINEFLGRWDLATLGVTNGELIFGKPPQLFYLVVLVCLLMLFVSRRLNNSRIGRRWMAMREDEDVAAAMGINTTNAKVIAFTLSAASGGLAGAVFAAKIGSIYPSSFQLLISVNVLSLIIVGGLASIPGVIVGAFALIGVPELLREFAEFRLLFYGIALIVMMLVRPEGLWPSEIKRRELGRDDEDVGLEPSIGD